MSDATTRGVRVVVHSAYVPERSSPREAQYFFAYRIRISNVGEETFQLISRHWVITDGRGEVEHVQGPGVVGEQPVLEPGETFEYTSFCPLPTPVTFDGRAYSASRNRALKASPQAGLSHRCGLGWFEPFAPCKNLLTWNIMEPP